MASQTQVARPTDGASCFHKSWIVARIRNASWAAGRTPAIQGVARSAHRGDARYVALGPGRSVSSTNGPLTVCGVQRVMKPMAS